MWRWITVITELLMHPPRLKPKIEIKEQKIENSKQEIEIVKVEQTVDTVEVTEVAEVIETVKLVKISTPVETVSKVMPTNQEPAKMRSKAKNKKLRGIRLRNMDQD
jgi:hypothetical protein